LGSKNFFSLEYAKGLCIFAFKVEGVCGYNDVLVKCPRGMRGVTTQAKPPVLSSSSLLLVWEARIMQRRGAKEASSIDFQSLTKVTHTWR